MRKFLKMKHQGFFIKFFLSFTAVLQMLVLSCLMCAAAVSFSDEAQASPVLNGINVETLADINHQDLQQILSHHYGQAVTAPLFQRAGAAGRGGEGEGTYSLPRKDPGKQPLGSKRTDKTQTAY